MVSGGRFLLAEFSRANCDLGVSVGLIHVCAGWLNSSSVPRNSDRSGDFDILPSVFQLCGRFQSIGSSWPCWLSFSLLDLGWGNGGSGDLNRFRNSNAFRLGSSGWHWFFGGARRNRPVGPKSMRFLALVCSTFIIGYVCTIYRV